MKKLIYLISFLFSFNLSAKEVKPELKNYEIISDKTSKFISKNKFVVEGTVYDFYTKEILADVDIFDGDKTKKSSKNGTFKIKTNIKNTHLVFSKLAYKPSYFEDYEFLGKHHIRVKIFLINSQQIEEQQFQVKKPVIYFYSFQEQEINFNFTPHGKLIFSYPKAELESELSANRTDLNVSENTYSWKVSYKNNQLTNLADQKKYPYLFWESEQNNVQFKATINPPSKRDFPAVFTYDGEFVSSKNILSFLDSTLTKLGFNATEKTDFITFWAPQMQDKPYYFIQFLQDDACNQFASYEITPKPDKVNRFYMLFAGLEQINPQIKTKKQNLNPLSRKNFYLVDWGGIELKEENLRF
jgi:hypothetical protein